jgi:NADPH2:quinone reductase
VTFAQGAAVNVPYATAYRALVQRAEAVAGEVVLVHGGSGGVGIAAIQLARAAGLTVIATAGSDEGKKLVAAQGAHHVIDHRAEQHFEQILELTRGSGVDVILEMAADINLGKDLPLLARGGRVVVIGSRGPVEINPRDTMARDACVLGMSQIMTPAADLARVHRALVAGLENGVLCPFVREEIPLSEAPRSHQSIMEPGALGKIVLIP